MTLRYNPKTQDYFVVSKDKARAEEIGMTLSKSIKGPQGEPVWFTQSPYAALQYYPDAVGEAVERLLPLWKDYEKSWAVETSQNYPSPAGKEFMMFQRAGIEYALAHGHTLIGDQPGLGKTVQAIGVANARRAERVLVVCPASVRLHWRRFVKDWSIIPNVTTYPILKSGNGVHPFSNYVIISYDLLRNENLHAALCEIKWDAIICDEAHYLKTNEAARTRALFGGGTGPFRNKRLADRSDVVIGLTGTPLPNRPRECYTLARALCFESIDWASEDDFRYRYNPSGVMETKSGDLISIEKKGRLPELQTRLRCNFMVRRLKVDVLKDLPDKTYELTYVEPNGKIHDVLQRERLIDFNIGDLKNPFGEIWGQVSTVRREMGEAMAPRVVEHIRYLLDVLELPKIVVFAHHNSVMNFIAEELKEYGVVQIRGGVGITQRDKIVQSFQKPGGARIFLGQMQAAGEGIDGLQNVSSHVVFAEPSWVPKDNEQCVDRLHRYGQHDNVIAQLMCVEGSLAERILGTMIDKSHVIHETLDKR